MGVVRFNKGQKNDTEIIKVCLKLLRLWREQLIELNILLDSSNGNKRNKILEDITVIKRQISFMEMLLKNSNLSDEEINIINDTLINKKGSMEKIGRKYFYSDSGIRNKVNLIMKKLLNEFYK